MIGINSQIYTGSSGGGSVGIGFAVPINTAKSELSQLKAGGTVRAAYIGLTSLTIDASLSALNLPVKSGALVQSVQKGTPAEKAGIRGGNISTENGQVAIGGDIITSIDGKTVGSSEDLANDIQARKPGDTVTVGDLTLDLDRHEVRRDGKTIELTAKEFDLLAYLMRNTGRVMSKDQITEHVWGYDSQATSNVVEIYIHYLRDKIDRAFARPLIGTVRGVGYTIKD